MTHAISRRALLGATGALGASALFGLRGIQLAGAQAPDDGEGSPSSAVQQLPTGPAVNLFDEPVINFQMLFALGAAGEGTAEYGEVATVIDRIVAAGSTFDAIHDEFVAMSRRVGARAGKSADAGHRVSARAQFLRSARYMTPPLYFVLGTSTPTKARARDDYQEMIKQWSAAARLFDPRWESVRIPYEKTTLPGWFLKAPGSDSTARPTIILNNGNDAQIPDIYAYGGAAALERGYNALIFEGPGQGSMLFVRGLPLRPDWDKVITPVVDYLEGRDDVDNDRIAIIGWSEGGELVAQALTNEHRLAAAVFDPGNLEELGAFASIPQPLIQLVQEGKKREANEEWNAIFDALPPVTQFAFTKGTLPFGKDNFYDSMKYISEFTLTPEQLGRIDTPVLVTEYEGETVYPGQAEQVFNALQSKRELVRFGADDGAQLHDAPMAPQSRNEAVFDWLDDQLQ